METFIVQDVKELREFMVWCYKNDSMHDMFADFNKMPLDIITWADMLGLEYPIHENDNDEYKLDQFLDIVDWKRFEFPSIVTFQFEDGFDRMGDLTIRMLTVTPVRSFNDFKDYYNEIKKERQLDYGKRKKYKIEKEKYFNQKSE